jgi:hypothetical protein
MIYLLPIILRRTGFFVGFMFTAVASFSRADPPGTGQAATAKIISVDHGDRSTILEIKKSQYRFVLSSRLIDLQTLQPLALAQVAPGQLIRFVSQPAASGGMEIVALTIIASEGVPAGEGGTASKGGPQAALGESPEATPFQ